MPLQPTTAQTRFENILTSLTAAMATFDEVSHSVETPFLRPISSTIQSLLTVVQTVKKNRDDCAQMLEQIHGLIYAIIRLHITSDTGSELPPDMLYNLGKFTETLHKIHAYFEAQQEKSRIKQFFRQGEMSTLLRGCNTGLAQALEVFKVQGNFNLQKDTPASLGVDLIPL
ncbi:hypothetical protein DFH09DRAFT_1277443 [Mycena vulgaris]|nr:hypothetical protein DFH09DRAFT_1277443 [Mycena vulgaris]